MTIKQVRTIVMTGMALFIAAPFSAAQALNLSESNGKAYMSGTLENGDEKQFAEFLAQPRAKPLRVLYLYSPGGKLVPAIMIGRMVRKAGLATAVNGTSEFCDSACTLIFAGGVRRHYINGDRVFEGDTGRTGLGFHPAWNRGYGTQASLRSDNGVDLMAKHYAAMGQPRAIELVRQAAFNTMFRPGGKTSLDYRIATSLRDPE
jgi:hypothetical protein